MLLQWDEREDTVPTLGHMAVEIRNRMNESGLGKAGFVVLRVRLPLIPKLAIRPFKAFPVSPDIKAAHSIRPEFQTFHVVFCL